MPEVQFEQRLAAFKAAMVQAKATEDDKGRLVQRVAMTVFGKHFRFSDPQYTKIYNAVPGIRSVKAELDGILASVTTHAANPGLAAIRKLDMITFYEKELQTRQQTLAKLAPAAQAAADALAASTSARYNATPPLSSEAVKGFLTADVPKHVVKAGARRSDYRSSHDQAEGNTFGASYKLDNTPYVLHLHVAGSGTHLSAMSVKSERNERGKSIVPNGWLEDTTLGNALKDSVGQAAENPRQIGLDRRDGIAATGRTW
jgi:hypothetical protein